MSSATLPELLDALDEGSLLLLPNARAAHSMRAAFDARQRQRGLPAWEPAPALSWSQWANSLWNDLIVAGAEERLLLNPAQEHSLWRQIIADDSSTRSIGSIDATAELARSAWQLASGYNATDQLRAFAMSHDSRIFAAWAQTFERLCADQGHLSAAQLNAALLQHVQRGTVAASATLNLIGFERLLPAQQALLAAFEARGSAVLERALKAPEDPHRLVASVASATEPEERALATHWIRDFLERHPSSESVTRIALLVPDLPEERAPLESLLRDVLTPELQSVAADLSSAPWEFSDGAPLQSLAMVVDALELIRWTQGPLPLERVSSLLLSPYLGINGTDASARNAAARFDASRLRRLLLLRSEIDIDGVLECLQRSDTGRHQTLANLQWLRNVRDFLPNSSDMIRPRGFAEWMELVRRILSAANWPGERALNASEFEATRAWESLLDLVSTLDFSGRRISLANALQALELQAQSATFTTPSVDAAVQVISIAEAEGSVFDAAVFLHATDANWPAPERVHPLLPWALQRAMKMPGSDPALGAAHCSAATANLLRSSTHVLFSYATEDENGKLRPSPILSELAVGSVDAARLHLPVHPILQVASEVLPDDRGLPPLPNLEVGGGSSVLKLQAACGFLAFAELRLRAADLKAGTLGLDAGESGSLLHRVLQHFWREIKTQSTLRAMSWTDRDQALTHAIDAALPSRLQLSDGWDRAYLWIQKQRLRTILQQWLDQELLRGPFTVSDTERKELVTVGPLTLEVRVDRVDSVGDGLFFVDYKTGASIDPKQWAGPRPDDPQLPLYTFLAEPEELKGIAFAKIRAGRDMKWQGYQAEDGIIPRTRSNIQDVASLADSWRHVLAHLAEDFAAGRADVHPKSFEINCVRCAQRLLCRIDPSSLQDSPDSLSDDAEDNLE